MVDFNPQFSTPDQSYLGWSKPSSQPEADKSTGIALKAFGEAGEEAVSLADTTIKGVIKDELSTRVDQQKQDFIDQLQAFKSQTSSKTNPMDANAAASDQDLMPDKGQDAPKDVDNALARVQNIANAKEQSSKFRTTSLDADLYETLKDVRSKYPGYRDYIDEKASSIIGYNPANKYIADQIAQLNEQTSNGRKEQDYYEKQIVNSGFSGSQQVLSQFKQDHDTSRVQAWLSKNNEMIEGVKNAAARFELSSKQHAYNQTVAEDAATTAAEHAATEFFTNRRMVNSDGTPGPTSSEISDKLLTLSQSPNGRDAEAIRNAGTQLLGLAQRNRDETMMYLRSVKNKDGKSIAEVLGPTRVGQILDSSIGNLYATQQKLLNDNNTGLLFSTQNAIGDLKNNDALTALRDPTTGGITRTATTLNTLFPNMSPELIKDVIGTQADYTKKLLNLSGEQKKQALAQTNGISTGPSGSVYTFKQFQDEQSTAQKKVNATDQDKAEATKAFLKLRSAFYEKDPRIVDNAISTFFHPDNRGNLSKYMDDYYDQSRNVIVKGRTGAYADLTSPGITRTIWDRSQNGNPDAWNWYKGWARTEGVSGLATIAKTWNVNEEQLANNRTLHGPEGDIPSGTDHHFYWNTDTHQIGITDLKGKPLNIDDTWKVNPDIFAVRNANMMLKNLRNIAEQEGSDVDAFLFKTMKDAGWAPPTLDTKGTATISDRIIKAVVQAHTPPKKDGEK